MTEAEWLEATDTSLLLQAARPLLSDRKFRLFACACARNRSPTSPHPDLSRGVEIAEQMADGAASDAVIEIARELFGSLFYVGDYEARGFVGENMFFASLLKDLLKPQIRRTRVIAWVSDYEAEVCKRLVYPPGGLAELRDIFGNPFRPAFSPSWFTDTVLSLARQMYDSRDFSPMPILADALQDAGCDDADVLGHCRGPGPHARGCWVVDELLGKS